MSNGIAKFCNIDDVPNTDLLKHLEEHARHYTRQFGRLLVYKTPMKLSHIHFIVNFNPSNEVWVESIFDCSNPTTHHKHSPTSQFHTEWNTHLINELGGTILQKYTKIKYVKWS